ncbi:Crp/Fnr family transcriptional regulator [Segetibacter aerophilus]|uniref:cAMP-binding protein n=1 Tax=Segetibacter aerophilus TaxID=670293 RepID=A0A512BGW3_9BACT|nr:Crp/Fnr family transcriptional regulator [Segetibacter aerophilus]GEO11204.1 cAMP-binding protein [Segetibacter aerophilus]
MYDILYNHFNKYVSLSKEDFEECKLLFKHKKYRKHQYILQQGEVSRHETFIVKGCTRTYEVDDTGQEHVVQFGLETWWVGDLHSFFTNSPTRYNIDCLEDTEVLQIPRTEMEKMYDKVPKLERFFRILIQKAYVASVERIYSSLSKPAPDRYQEFVDKYPDIEQRVPNHQIASFLGITPQSLSRIRSQSVSRKKVVSR